MKNSIYKVIKGIILVIMVQNVAKDQYLYAAEAGQDLKNRVSGQLTSLEIQGLSPSCAGGNDGVADLTIIGSDAPYSIRWSDGSTDEDLANLVPGSYYVVVTGLSGESLATEVVVPESSALLLNTEFSQVTCHNGNNGSISLEISGGAAPYAISCNGHATGTNISGLTAGVYHVRVADAYGCLAERTVSIQENSVALDFETREVTCHGASDGAVVIFENSSWPDARYSWSDGSTSRDKMNLSGGIYSLEVSNADGCVSNYAFAIYEPQAMTLEMTSADAACVAGGKAEVLVVGGEAPYLFNWSDGSEIANLDRLSPGDYSVIVTDSKLCTATGKVKVGGVYSQMTLLLTAVSASCASDDDGSIDLHVAGGREPYQYLWSNGNTAEDQLLVIPGMYTVSVTDASGCVQSSAIELEAPAPLSATISEFSSGCSGSDHGISVVVSGGSSPYKFNWSDGSRTSSILSKEDGIYSVQVTDASGCSVELHTLISAAPAISVTEEIEMPSGQNKSDGQISVNVQGGVAPYIYEWSNGSSGESVSGLLPGHYSLIITDSRGCSFDMNFDLRIGYGEEQSAASVREPSGSMLPFEVRILNAGSASLQTSLVLMSNQDDLYSIAIFDIAGRKLADVANDQIRAREERVYEIPSNGLNTGVYVLKISSTDRTQAVKLNIIN